jgi:metal-responsive CopG/Arc/MetJ family transcriptional regulator
MAARKQSTQKERAERSLRASVSFPSELYRNLEEVARQKKVSVAWVVREAVEKYLAEQLPLFNQEVWRKR